jgi:hypothetical protein
MQIRPQKYPSSRPTFGGGRFVFASALLSVLILSVEMLLHLLPDTSFANFLLLGLVLFGAFGVGRELLTPSLKELAFYSAIIVAAVLIWPAAHLVTSAYQTSGFVSLVAFMVLVSAMALVLGVLSANLLAEHDGME